MARHCFHRRLVAHELGRGVEHGATLPPARARGQPPTQIGAQPQPMMMLMMMMVTHPAASGRARVLSMRAHGRTDNRSLSPSPSVPPRAKTPTRDTLCGASLRRRRCCSMLMRWLGPRPRATTSARGDPGLRWPRAAPAASSRGHTAPSPHGRPASARGPRGGWRMRRCPLFAWPTQQPKVTASSL
jgi:hypothetical protein